MPPIPPVANTLAPAALAIESDAATVVAPSARCATAPAGRAPTLCEFRRA
jgi:hypothetical protein